MNADASKRSTKITINPADGTVNGNHNIIVTWTPKYGSAFSYTALTFKVDCKVTSFTKPAAPVNGAGGFDFAYTVFEAPLSIDISTLTYVQVPACGYTFTSVYTWSSLPASIVEAPANSGKLIVSSSNLAHVATSNLYWTNVITIPTNGPDSNVAFNVNQVSDRIAFDVVVSDPCAVSTANAVIFHDSFPAVITS